MWYWIGFVSALAVEGLLLIAVGRALWVLGRMLYIVLQSAGLV